MLNSKKRDKKYKERIRKGKLIFSNFENNKKFFEKEKTPKKNKILEIGCGTGYFLSHLKQKGYKKLSGCEISKVALRYGKKNNKNIDYRLTSDSSLPFQSGQFDTALSFDVIEHIPNTISHFQEVKRVLKKNGHYLFSTPNKLWDRLFHLGSSKHFKNHCSLQSKKTLQRITNKIGFFGITFEKIKYKLSDKQKVKIKNKGLDFTIPIVKFLIEKHIISPNIYGVIKK